MTCLNCYQLLNKKINKFINEHFYRHDFFVYIVFLINPNGLVEFFQGEKEGCQPRRLKMLFLGHALEHHKFPTVYMPILASSLNQKWY